MSYHACKSPTKVRNVSNENHQELYWAEKSTPLLGRRKKRRGVSPNSDDEEGTMSMLSQAMKRAKITKKDSFCQAFNKSRATSEIDIKLSGKSPSTQLPELTDDVSVTQSYQNVMAVGKIDGKAARSLNRTPIII